MGGGGGLLGGIFGGKGGGGSESSGYTNIDIDTTKNSNPFSSEESRKNYVDYMNAAKGGYEKVLNYEPEMLKGIQGLDDSLAQYQKQGGVGDTSYFKQAWGQAQGIDQSNLNKMNSQSLDPYKDEVTKNYIDASNKAAYLANGQNVNQMMQNMIGSNMANGSGHQTAAAKVGANLAANINAQNQQTYLARQNQLEQNALAANNQLGNFYNTLSNIGIDYAKLNQQDLATMLSAYQTRQGLFDSMFNGQNNALGQYGAAVAMGSDPEETSHQHKEGVESQSTQNQQSAADGLGNLASAVGTALFFCFTGDTLVKTPDGDVAIKDIKVGDKVYSFDSKDNTINVAEVIETLDPRESDIIDVSVGDKLVSTTSSQPFLTEDNSFIDVKDMVAGETSLKEQGLVTDIKHRDKKENVYDIKLSRGDCYFANGFVVKAADTEW